MKFQYYINLFQVISFWNKQKKANLRKTRWTKGSDPANFRAFALLLTSTDPVPGVGYLYTFNPLNPKSDQHQISPHNITPELYVKVMRIKEMITNERIF